MGCIESKTWLEGTEFSNGTFDVAAAAAAKIMFQHPYVYIEF